MILFGSPVRAIACTLMAVLLAGCGGGQTEHETFLVKGKVSFNGEPVTEGIVTFEDSTNGRTGESEIAADGIYRVRVTKGSYKVMVNPPTVQVDEGPESPPSEGVKDVDNIPEKYRGYQSGVIVDVSDDMDTGADVAMMPEG